VDSLVVTELEDADRRISPETLPAINRAAAAWVEGRLTDA
jgi:hypothetical protein